MTEITAEQVVEVVVKAADDKMAQNIIALDVSQQNPLTDYFVILNGGSGRQINAIVDGILEACKKNNIPVKSIEGKNSSNWILIDLNYVIVHVFGPEEREFYNLEKIWVDAPSLDVEEILND